MKIGQIFYDLECLSSLLLVLIAGCGDSGMTGPGGGGVQSKIAFVSNRDGNDEIYVMNPDGTNPTRLTTDWGTDWSPAWSPDGTKIAFFSERDRYGGIYVMNADGTNPTRLIIVRGWDWPFRPAWSPDGTRIAFPSQPYVDPSPSGNNAIYAMRADGTDITRLTVPEEDRYPIWSPDGAKILFVSNRSRRGTYVMNADGTNLTLLLQQVIGSPAWSPDGTKIAFVQLGNAPFGDIYVMNANGTNPIQLTTCGECNAEPTWSPDGAKIAFTSNRNRIPEIWLMNADGTNQMQLTWNPSYGFVHDPHDTSPAWSLFLKR